jgi:hypothetical protein
MLTIREGSRQKAKFTFEDEERHRFTPTSIRYRVHDRESGDELIAWTAVTPASQVQITIPASANRILDDCNRYEYRVVTVQSDFGTDDQLSDEDEYRVKNLSGFE